MKLTDLADSIFSACPGVFHCCNQCRNWDLLWTTVAGSQNEYLLYIFFSGVFFVDLMGNVSRSNQEIIGSKTVIILHWRILFYYFRRRYKNFFNIYRKVDKMLFCKLDYIYSGYKYILLYTLKLVFFWHTFPANYTEIVVFNITVLSLPNMAFKKSTLLFVYFQFDYLI